MNFAARMAMIAVLAALGVVTAGALFRETASFELPESAARASFALRALPVATHEAGGALLDRSPFAPDRSAYRRAEAASEPSAPPPDVRVVAIFAAGGEPRATLVIDGMELTVGAGDATPLGEVVAISGGAVVLGDGLRVSLFD
jgi:hypothetical protein